MKGTTVLAGITGFRPPPVNTASEKETARTSAAGEEETQRKVPLPVRLEARIGAELCDLGYRLSTTALFAFCASALASFALMFVFAEPVMAQDGTSAVQPIMDFLTQVRNGLALLITGFGGVAMLACCIVWMLSGSNDKRREKATSWMGTIIVATCIGLAVPLIIGILQQLIPQGGGGGGG